MEGKPGRDWEAWAKERGYTSLKGMLKHLYEKEGLRGRRLGEAMECSHIRVLQLMEECGIKRKPAGGAMVRKGEFKLNGIPEDEILKDQTRDIAEKYGVHVTTVRRFKRTLQDKMQAERLAKERAALAKVKAAKKAAATPIPKGLPKAGLKPTPKDSSTYARSGKR